MTKLAPVTRYAVSGGCWLHLGSWRKGKPVYGWHPERAREPMPKYDTNPRREESAG